MKVRYHGEQEIFPELIMQLDDDDQTLTVRNQ